MKAIPQIDIADRVPENEHWLVIRIIDLGEQSLVQLEAAGKAIAFHEQLGAIEMAKLVAIRALTPAEPIQ